MDDGFNDPRDAQEAPRPGAGSSGIGHIARDLASTLLPAIALVLVLQLFLAQSTVVYGESMEPNLGSAQRLVVEKLSYHLRHPVRGDIVILLDPTGGPIPLIKRVVGLPGERISISGGRVRVDGVPLNEAYLSQVTAGDGHSWQVPPSNVFVMGDNRSNSKDSRYFGPVPVDSILGHAIFRFWPPDKLGAVK